MGLVLFVHQASELYGSDRVLQLLVTGFAASGEYTPVVVVPEPGPLVEALRAHDIEVHVAEVAKISRAAFTAGGLMTMPFELLRSVRELDGIVAGRPIALVHSNTLAVLGGAAWAAWRRVPHVWHVHELITTPKLAARWLPRVAEAASRKVIANSRQTFEWLVQAAPGLRRKGSVVFNGLPSTPDMNPELVQRFRRAVGAREDDLVISLVGRINRWKGHRLLIEAAEILARCRELDHLRFAFVGSPAPGLEHMVGDLRQEIASRGLGDHFSLLAFVEDVWPVWYGSDIGVVPSTEPEPFGMVAIEAMSVGVPVIVAAHGGLVDIVENERSGLTFEPGNAHALAEAILRLKGSREQRRKLGNAGRMRQLRDFSFAALLEGTAAVYRAAT